MSPWLQQSIENEQPQIEEEEDIFIPEDIESFLLSSPSNTQQNILEPEPE